MKSLVLGSKGFVGRSLCKYLENSGQTVVHFDYTIGNDGRFDTLKLDDIDYVFFLAWDVGGAKYLYNTNNQLHQLKWNIQLLTNVMLQLEKFGTPFLFTSSQLSETSTSYGITKKLGELWTSLLNQSCVRLWNIYGVYEEYHEKSHVIGDFIHQAIRNNCIKMMTTGDEHRQFLYISDFNKAVYYIQQNNIKGIYDLSDNVWTKIIDIADIIGEYTGSSIEAGNINGHNTDIYPKNLLPGWTPSVDLVEGLCSTVDIYETKIKTAGNL